MENIDKFIVIGATLVLVVVIVLWSVLSFVLNYHWSRYGIEREQVKKVKLMYLTVSVTLMIFMIVSYLSIL
jgi:uncharacterized BrkB/YihY/UPF0761 family membrane protein